MTDGQRADGTVKETDTEMVGDFTDIEATITGSTAASTKEEPDLAEASREGIGLDRMLIEIVK